MEAVVILIATRTTRTLVGHMFTRCIMKSVELDSMCPKECMSNSLG